MGCSSNSSAETNENERDGMGGPQGGNRGGPQGGNMGGKGQYGKGGQRGDQDE